MLLLALFLYDTSCHYIKPRIFLLFLLFAFIAAACWFPISAMHAIGDFHFGLRTRGIGRLLPYAFSPARFCLRILRRRRSCTDIIAIFARR